MKIEKLSIDGLFKITPKIYKDQRGYFFESFKKDFFYNNISKKEFVQENESLSNFGVLRGFHFQKPPFAQSKLVRCIKGKVLDVALDLRKNSKTFGKYEKIILSDTNNVQFYIPQGFAHAFLVLSKEAIFSYKVDNIYSPDHDSGIIWNDPDLNIDWGISKQEIKISKKDSELCTLSKLISPF